MSINKKVAERLMAGIKKFRPIVSQAQKGELREADTVNIVRDIFSELFGYDRYSEITSEHAIKGTYVDLAIKVQQKNQSKSESHTSIFCQ